MPIILRPYELRDKVPSHHQIELHNISRREVGRQYFTAGYRKGAGLSLGQFCTNKLNQRSQNHGERANVLVLSATLRFNLEKSF